MGNLYDGQRPSAYDNNRKIIIDWVLWVANFTINIAITLE